MHYVKLSFVAGLTTLMLSGNLCACAYAREIAIIANKDYTLNSISASAIKNIYLGEKTSEGGVRVKPMEQRDEAIKKRFIEKVMGSTVDGYKAYWIKKFFQEGVTPPTAKGTPSELIDAISNTGGAIGYVWVDDVKGEAGVKVLLKIEVGN